jgi:trehalose synthase
MSLLDQYLPIIGEQAVDELRFLGRELQGRVMRHINSTAVGGGVAELLNRMIPYFKELGVDARWEVIKGDNDFYAVTKKMHNALHGHPQPFTLKDFEIYNQTIERNVSELDLTGDALFIHDPQPAGLISQKRNTAAHWVWRCHIDLSERHEDVWKFLEPMVEDYEAAIFSAPAFAQQLSTRQVLIAPSIDPFSDKNRELTAEEVQRVRDQFRLDPDRPLVTQVSRFDRLKDPVGVIEAYRLAKQRVDFQLLLVGGSATDDPEGNQVLAEVRERAGNDPDIHILELDPTSNFEINALQRASTIILQKSLKEGFGLTVTEALWKGKPVIAGATGGIPLQITHKFSGILTRSIEGTAFWIKQLLQEPQYAKRLGENGRAHVRENFLTTRHLKDYLALFLSLYHVGDVVTV